MKKNQIRRLCAWLLTCVLICSVLPIPCMAEETAAQDEQQEMEFLTEAELLPETESELPADGGSVEQEEMSDISEESPEEPAAEPEITAAETAAAEETAATEEPAEEVFSEAESAEEPMSEESSEAESVSDPESTEDEITEAETTEEVTDEETTEDETTEEETIEETTDEEKSTEEETIEETTDEEKGTEEETIEDTTAEESTEEELLENDIEQILSRPLLQDLGEVSEILKINSCRISGSQVVIEGKSTIPFSTADHKLYLFEQKMYQYEISGKPVASIQQKSDGTFRFQIPLRQNTAESRINSKFFAGVKFRNGTYFALSNGHFITNPEALASNQSAYPAARSKKGLLTEFYWGTDMEELGLSHANVNFFIDLLVNGSGISYTYNGKNYQFSSEYVGTLDRQVTTLQKSGIIVTGVLVCRPGAAPFNYPGIGNAGTIQGWNVVTNEGVEYVSALLHFLAERYERSDNAYGHVANWIVGNEVNAESVWNNMGHPGVETYAKYYANMVRITYQAMRSVCSHARVFISLDMFWDNVASSERYDGKKILVLVNQYLKAEGDIPWGVAYHPYANPLSEPEFWNDHAEQNENAGFISMQNISVLTNYLQYDWIRDPDGSVKHVILSEEGFTSYSENQGNTEWKQAAAYAYAYYIAEANPYIDAIIVMRQKDADVEANAGLHQGLWYDNTEKNFFTYGKKPVWTVWKYVDTAHSFEYTDSLASIVGLSSFSSVYGSVMASKKRTVSVGTGGTASGFNGSAALADNWSPQYMVSGFKKSGSSIQVTAGANSPYAYSGIVWNGNANFSSKRYFGFDFNGTAGASQNLRVRIRFNSGENIYETEIPVLKNTQQKLYVDLGGWSGKSSVNKIQIWVQQDGTDLWQNGSYTVSGICQASSLAKKETATIEIQEAKVSKTTSTGFDLYCKVASTKSLSRVEYSAWRVAEGTDTAVTKNGTVSGKTSTAHFNVSEFGGKTGAYEVRIVAYDSDGRASKDTIVSVTVKGRAEALKITNHYASQVSISGFYITLEASSDYGLSGTSSMAVWSVTGWQDDLQWYPLNFSNGTARVWIPVSAHKNSTGEYNCHAYIRDNGGNTKLSAITVTVPSSKPKIISANATAITTYGYRVTCTFDCPNGVQKVMLPSWTKKNGQDDLKWHQASVSGNTATLYIRSSVHNRETGQYYTHIYVYDKTGQYTIRSLSVVVPETTDPSKLLPTVKNVKTTELTSKGYRVSAEFSAPVGLKEVAVPTWTVKNGQDDLKWQKASISGNKATVYVPVSQHNSESGSYRTNVYVRDQAGNEAVYRITVKVPAAQPTAKLQVKSVSTTNVTSSGYQVTAVVEAPAGIKQVLIPTWTAKNGQDDIIWHVASLKGNTASFYVKTSAHKGESGLYYSHVYVYDKNGKSAMKGTSVTVPAAAKPKPAAKLAVTSIKITDKTSSGYRVTATFTAPAGVQKVLMPTWTARNGQDDLVWHAATVKGNTATFYVSASSHKNEKGTYYTHVYVYDTKGAYAFDGTTVEVK